jgi:hypothetical protein
MTTDTTTALTVSPLEPLDCAEVASWVDDDPLIRQGLRLPEDMGAIDIELALISTIGSNSQIWCGVRRYGELVGVVGASHVNGTTAVVHQVVSPAHRFGKTAFKAAKAGIDWARRELGVQDLVAYVPRYLGSDKETPHPAIRLNRALGFEPQDVEVLILRTASEKDSDHGP